MPPKVPIQQLPLPPVPWINLFLTEEAWGTVSVILKAARPHHIKRYFLSILCPVWGIRGS